MFGRVGEGQSGDVDFRLGEFDEYLSQHAGLVDEENRELGLNRHG